VAASQASIQKRDAEYQEEFASPEYSNNYYQNQQPYRPRPVKQSYSPFGWVQNLFRRSSYDSGSSSSGYSSAPSHGGGYHQQAVSSGPGIADIILPIILICLGLGLAALAAAAITSSLSSSGRGLDTDEWEVDHSVWMNQLQKDFEDSWATEE